MNEHYMDPSWPQRSLRVKNRRVTSLTVCTARNMLICFFWWATVGAGLGNTIPMFRNGLRKASVNPKFPAGLAKGLDRLTEYIS